MKTVHELLMQARAALPHRPSPLEAVTAQRAGALLIDIRGDDQRREGGLIPGALLIPRNALEWRCDPDSAWRHPLVHGYGQQLILVCDQGFQSSLAAANLQQLGLRLATDVDGGFVAYAAAGLPVVHPTRAHGGSRGAARQWDAIHDSRNPEQMSWYQATSETSLSLLGSLAVSREAAVIDIGAGTSSFAELLLERGFSDVSVLDVSMTGLRNLTARLGAAARRVHVIRRNLLTWRPRRSYDVWHDRAVLHFFVDPVDRARYVDVLDSALAPGAKVIIGVFAADGPSDCSGLPVMGYSAAQLAELLGDRFHAVEERREEHLTPGGAAQPFTWVAFSR
jgi:rhodanese-related sulfurtransferase